MKKLSLLDIFLWGLAAILAIALGIITSVAFNISKSNAPKPEPVPVQEDRRFTTERIWSKGSLIADVVTDKETGRKYILNWNGGVLELNQNKL